MKSFVRNRGLFLDDFLYILYKGITHFFYSQLQNSQLGPILGQKIVNFFKKIVNYAGPP